MIRRLVACCLALSVVLGCSSFGGGKPKSSLESILERGQLRIGMSGEQPPLNMTAKTGDLVGLEVALGRVLAQIIGVEAVFVRKPFHELFDAIEEGKVDIAMSGIGITPQRNLRVAFVGPYFVSGKSILTKREDLLSAKDPGALDRADLKIVALAGSTSEEYVRRSLPNAQLLTSDGLDAAVQLVADGGADALLADLETCHFAALRRPGSGLRSLEKTFTTEPIGIALPPDDPQLINLLDNYLNTLERQGGLKRARDYWFENDAWLGSIR